MTRSGAGCLAVLRVVLAAVIIVDLSSFFFYLGAARSIAVANGTLNPFNDVVSMTAVRSAVILLGIAAAVVLALCVVVAIGHQGRRFAEVQAAGAAADRPPVASAVPADSGHSPPPARPTALRQIGPFAVGDPIVGGWTVDAVEIHADTILTALTGPPGRVVFEMTCAPSDHQGLFDLGAAHVFYSSDLQIGELEPAGWALRAEMQAAAEDDDICERMASWRASAQAGEPR